jgi:hypothetical protein
MNDKKRTYNRIQKPIDDDNNSLYEIIELNESESIIFHIDKNKPERQLYKTANIENNKHLILVIPAQAINLK